MKYGVKFSTRFKKDMKLVQKRGYNQKLLYDVIEKLANGEKLEEKYKDHQLSGDYSGFSGISAFEQMNSYIEQKDCKYPNSAKKIAFMMRRYEEDGFTSYWL